MADKKRYYIELTDEDEEILGYEIGNINEWLSILVDNKISQCEKIIVETETDRQPKKLSRTERRGLIKNTEFKVRKKKRKAQKDRDKKVKKGIIKGDRKLL